MRIAIIGTYPPRQCGIATFTHDLYHAITFHSDYPHGIIAITDGTEQKFPDEVVFTIKQAEESSYLEAAKFINSHFDICLVQHEYGIFGGNSGEYILSLLENLTIPVTATLHTVLQHPSPAEYTILRRLAQFSSQLIVMTGTAIEMLKHVFQIDTAMVTMIPHGVPQFDFNQFEAKRNLGLLGKKVMLTFGFLGKNKGIETAIDALTEVEDDDILYIVLGTTHPNVVKHEGEAYRDILLQKVKELQLEGKVIFINSFASEELLIQYLTACDIYVTPYPHENQISSGTLSFAVGAGAAVISTPYWYAKDLLQEERGLLFDFNDAHGLANLINRLIGDHQELTRYRNNAASYGQQTSWNKIGKKYLESLKEIVNRIPEKLISLDPSDSNRITEFTTVNTKRLSS